MHYFWTLVYWNQCTGIHSVTSWETLVLDLIAVRPENTVWMCVHVALCNTPCACVHTSYQRSASRPKKHHLNLEKGSVSRTGWRNRMKVLFLTKHCTIIVYVHCGSGAVWSLQLATFEVLTVVSWRFRSTGMWCCFGRGESPNFVKDPWKCQELLGQQGTVTFENVTAFISCDWYRVVTKVYEV